MWAQLIAEAITICQRRAGVSGRDLCGRADMSYPTFVSRTTGRASFTLNEIERIAPALGVSPLEISQIAAKLGELAPAEDKESRS